MGYKREPWQLAALQLEKRHTILISPRQVGKSQSLALLSLHRAFREPYHMVLIVSAGDEAAKRLLRMIREIASHPLLAESVEDETQSRIILSNSSEIRSVPASERQIRGFSVDTLVVDEAAFVDDDVLVSAAIPTTTARPEARIVFASTPWGDSGCYANYAEIGREATNPHFQTFMWKRKDAWWISEAVVEAAKATMSPIRFQAEYEGIFVSAGDAYFNKFDILAATCDYPLNREGHERMPAACGLDWGRQQDAHAIVLTGLLDDYGVNKRSVIIVPWLETSHRPYGQQIMEIEVLSKLWLMTVHSETNGVGAYPTEELVKRISGWTYVIPEASTQRRKEDFYGKVAVLLAERQMVLPNREDFLRQIGGVVAEPTPSGGLRIAARTESLHDDFPDALSLSVGALPNDLADVTSREPPPDIKWAKSNGGIEVPLPVRTLPAEWAWDESIWRGPAPDAKTGIPTIDDVNNPWMEVYGPVKSTTPNGVSSAY